MKKDITRMIERNNLVKHDFTRDETDNEIRTKRKILTETDDIIEEPKKYIPILDKCDVLVVGGGPSGLSAAIGAARTGVKTIIIEKYGCLGGVITTVGMETLGWYRYEGTEDCSGIGTEMEKIAAKMGGTLKWAYNDSECLDAEFFKVVADRLMEDNNIKSILHCYAVECIITDNIIKGVIIESKSGRMAILSDRVIDCTGDGDVCYLAGADYTILDKKERMGVTSVFNCSGVDKDKFMTYVNNNKKTYKDWGNDWCTPNINKEADILSPYLDSEFQEAIDKDIISNTNSNIKGTWSSITDAGEATNLNLIHMKGYDTMNINDLTKAEIQGRKQTLEAIKALKEIVPGFEKAKLRNYGMTLGIRDSRKIICEYNLTKNDVMNQGRYNDAIGIFPEFIDGYNVLMLPTTGRYFQIPLRSVIPLKIDNLLVAGRCIGGDKISHAAMRNMMACTVTGQGAGVAAAVSLIKNTIVRDVNCIDVQRELLKQNVKLNLNYSKL